MTESELRRLSSSLGYHFKDLKLLRRALTHRSAGPENNERLEFLGDAVLDLVVAEELFFRFPSASEGELTRFRSALVKGKTLVQIARELDLGSAISLGGGELKSGGRHRESILADGVEAVLGAIFLESGLDACRDKIKIWFGGRLDAINADNEEKDAKTRLQEYLQSRGDPLPVYTVVSAEGEPHDQILTVACQVKGLSEPVIARASNRKKAEKKAASLALAHLGGDHD